MATCAVAVQQANGSYALFIDPSVTDVSTCSYVVQSGPDIANSLLTMSVQDGAIYGSAISGVFIAAWCFTAISRALKGGSNEST